MNELLRHTVATLAYRGGKVVRGVPATFADFRAAETTRTPLQILSHLGDLLDWAYLLARGEKKWSDAVPQSWDAEVQRVDQQLANEALKCPPERLFQGPIADALTHIGQIAILRRMAGVPVRGENYFAADIVAGRVGTEQASPKREFD